MPKPKLPLKKFLWTPELAYVVGLIVTDGTIYTYKDMYNKYKGRTYINTRVYTKFISASEKHIKWLFSMIRKYSPVRGSLQSKRPKQNRVRMWEIKISKYESLRLFPWLYYKKGLPTLQRKRKIAESLLNRIINGKLIR